MVLPVGLTDADGGAHITDKEQKHEAPRESLVQKGQ